MLTEVTSVLVYSSQRVRRMTGNLGELEAFYGKVRTHNLLAGWWAIPFGLIFNPIALRDNRRALRAVRDRAASGAAPGWYPDPTGRHAVRYWAAGAWTAQVSDLTTDSIEPKGKL